MTDGVWLRGGQLRSPYLDTEESAGYLRISERTLINMRQRRIGPKPHYHGSRVFYHIDELDAWSRDNPNDCGSPGD